MIKRFISRTLWVLSVFLCRLSADMGRKSIEIGLKIQNEGFSFPWMTPKNLK